MLGEGSSLGRLFVPLRWLAAIKWPQFEQVTTKHLAYALAEQHQFTKKEGQEMLAGLVGMITKHLKKGERVKIAGLGILQVGIGLPAWAAIR